MCSGIGVRFVSSMLGVDREIDPESRAPPGGALERDACAHQLCEPARDREPDAGALDRSRFLACAVKRLEDLILLIERDADAVVGHRHAREAVAEELDGELRAARGLAVLQRVGAEVDQDLREARAVRHHLRQVLWVARRASGECLRASPSDPAWPSPRSTPRECRRARSRPTLGRLRCATDRGCRRSAQ